MLDLILKNLKSKSNHNKIYLFSQYPLPSRCWLLCPTIVAIRDKGLSAFTGPVGFHLENKITSNYLSYLTFACNKTKQTNRRYRSPPLLRNLDWIYGASRGK